jgi:hypothetical protein
MLGTQTASIFTLRFAENAESNVPKWIRSEAQTLHIVFVTEYYFGNYYIHGSSGMDYRHDKHTLSECIRNR